MDEGIRGASPFSPSCSAEAAPQYFLEWRTRAPSWSQGPLNRARDEVGGGCLLGLPHRIQSWMCSGYKGESGCGGERGREHLGRAWAASFTWADEVLRHDCRHKENGSTTITELGSFYHGRSSAGGCAAVCPVGAPALPSAEALGCLLEAG